MCRLRDNQRCTSSDTTQEPRASPVLAGSCQNAPGTGPKSGVTVHGKARLATQTTASFLWKSYLRTKGAGSNSSRVPSGNMQNSSKTLRNNYRQESQLLNVGRSTK